MGGGLGPSSPFATLFTDLSADLSPGWQMIDMGIRCFRTALKTPDFQKASMGKVNTVIRQLASTATNLLSHYTSGKSGPGAPLAGDVQKSTDTPELGSDDPEPGVGDMP
jgi:hypothetical protein